MRIFVTGATGFWSARSPIGFAGAVFTVDVPASGARTRERLGWAPVRADLVEDRAAGHHVAGPRS